MAHEVWEEYHDRLAALITAHRTTLVFVNTRRMAERLARHLSDRLGDDAVTAHHGSLSKETRLDAETQAQGGSPARPRRDRLARARHRHRACGSRLPDWIAAPDRHAPAAGGTIRPHHRGTAQGTGLSDLARRPRRVRGAAAIGPARRPRCDRRPRRAARRAGAADRGRDGLRRVPRRRPVRAGARGVALPRPHARGVRRGPQHVVGWLLDADEAGARRSSTATRSTRCSAAGAAAGCWRRHPAAPFPRSPTSASSSTRKTRSSARSTRTSRSSRSPATSFNSATRRGGSCR